MDYKAIQAMSRKMNPDARVYPPPPSNGTPSLKTYYDQGPADSQKIPKKTIEKDKDPLEEKRLNTPSRTFDEIVDQYNKQQQQQPQPQQQQPQQQPQTQTQTLQETAISDFLDTNDNYIQYNGGEIPGNSIIATINRDNTINTDIKTQVFSTFSPYHMGNKIVAIKKTNGGKKRSQKRSQKRKRNKKSKLKSKRR